MLRSRLRDVSQSGTFETIFEEFLAIVCSQLTAVNEKRNKGSIMRSPIVSRAYRSCAVELTRPAQGAPADIRRHDIRETMNRHDPGDVGSGKTIMRLWRCLQRWKTVIRQFNGPDRDTRGAARKLPAIIREYSLPVSLLTGSLKAAEKRMVKAI